ncbi:hypothetical protein N7490_012269 [Penicillium lividum]|nr:hypothetical protein N7490_012269 [Penicillium lividum]
MSEPYMDAEKIEACPRSDYIENRQASGRPAHSRPTARRVLANPSPLGLLSFATAYTDASGNIQSTFYDALGMYGWAWFILSVIYTLGASRSSWILLFTLFFLDIELLLLATGYMLNNDHVLVAGNSVGFVVAFCSYWAGTAAFLSEVTPLAIPTFPMHEDH